MIVRHVSNLPTVDSLVNIFFAPIENFSSHVSKEISLPVPFRAAWVPLTFASLSCWRCNSRMPVVALLVPHEADSDGQICLLSNLHLLVLCRETPSTLAAAFHFDTRSCIQAGDLKVLILTACSGPGCSETVT